MIFQQPTNTSDFFRQVFFSRNVLSRLMLINTVIFLIINIIGLFLWLFGFQSDNQTGLSLVAYYLAVPSNLETLGQMPWTILTYMVTQEGFFHLIFNLILLYFGGTLFLEYLNERKLLSTYIIGGIVGAIFFIGAFNIFPIFQGVANNAMAVGASASVLAIFIAIATYVPDYTIHLFIFGRVKMKYLALAFIVIDLLSIRSGNPGGHIAHLGGALWGFLYAYQLKKGVNLYWFIDYFRNIAPTGNPTFMKSSTQSRKTKKPLSDEEYNSRRVATQEQIDKILDKIGRSGYSSLTNEEKELLFKTSNKK
ncbi:MAG: rhomboid family intramembrane serine protease [Bacteroidales bacterium]|nr:rhomboid family intramembrane serine protease [Bacteroidales bacterium]